MFSSFRTVVVVVVLLCLTLSGGVALADPSNLERVEDSKETSTATGVCMSLLTI